VLKPWPTIQSDYGRYFGPLGGGYAEHLATCLTRMQEHGSLRVHAGLPNISPRFMRKDGPTSRTAQQFLAASLSLPIPAPWRG
jgi:hypothetical protein